MKTSVVIVTYRRMVRLKEIVYVWCQQTSDVWLCDCSKEGINFDKSDINYVRFCPDPGNKVRHAVALLTEGDLVIKADDDIMPKLGLIDDFIYWHNKLGDCIMGIHGRTFHGLDYYRDTKLYASHMLKKAFKVDFLGVITCAPRKFLPMDLRGCLTPIEDIYWHNAHFPHVPKYIIPTNNYDNKLPESKDVGRLCGNKEMRKIRREYYRKIYLRFYK